MATKNLAAQLTQPLPDVESMDDLKQQLDADQEPAEAEEEEAEEKPAPAPVDPRQKLKEEEEYTFEFKWQASPRSKVWKGTFTNKVPDLNTQRLIGLMRARLAGGVPFDSLDPLTNELLLIYSHLAYSLTQKPVWFAEVGKLKDIRLLQELYLEVASHEATFLGQ